MRVHLDGYKEEWVGKDVKPTLCSKIGSIITPSVQCKHLGKGLKLQYRTKLPVEIKLKTSTGNRKGGEDGKGHSSGWTIYEVEVIEGWNKGFIMHAVFWFPFYKAMRNAGWLGSIEAHFLSIHLHYNER